VQVKMNKMFKGFVVTAMTVGAVSMSLAQTNGQHDLSFRLGAEFESTGGNNTNWAAGLDYKLPMYKAPAARGSYQSYFGISGDYYGRSNNYNIPIAATYNVRAAQLVFSGGVGIDFSKDFGSTTSGLGFQLAATYEFSGTGAKSGTGAPIFIQVKYFFANQTDLSGFAAYLGIRF
jgi:hypothetical protein